MDGFERYPKGIEKNGILHSFKTCRGKRAYKQKNSSLWDVKGPTRYSRRVGDEVPGVVAVLFSSAEVAGLAVMSPKRLVVYEAT